MKAMWKKSYRNIYQVYENPLYPLIYKKPGIARFFDTFPRYE